MYIITIIMRGPLRDRERPQRRRRQASRRPAPGPRVYNIYIYYVYMICRMYTQIDVYVVLRLGHGRLAKTVYAQSPDWDYPC